MCLIAMAWGMHPDYPLVIAANRDEWFARPTVPLAQWNTDSGHSVISGRDLQGGGTWMGFSPNGRFAMLTNVRKGAKATINKTSTAPSRGHLVTSWLCSSATAHDWAAAQTPQDYEGFNLIVGDWAGQTCHYLTNQDTSRCDAAFSALSLSTGHIFGLSNAALDTPWPKTVALCAALRSALAQPHFVQTHAHTEGGLLQTLQLALQDHSLAADSALPHTGVPIALERNLSSVFVRHPRDGATATYGTRSSLCVLLHRGGQLRLRETTHAGSAHAGSAHPPADAAPSTLELSLQWPAGLSAKDI